MRLGYLPASLTFKAKCRLGLVRMPFDAVHRGLRQLVTGKDFFGGITALNVDRRVNGQKSFGVPTHLKFPDSVDNLAMGRNPELDRLTFKVVVTPIRF